MTAVLWWRFPELFKDRIIFTDCDLPKILILCNRYFLFTVRDHWLLIIFLLGWINPLFVLVPHSEFMRSTSQTRSVRILQWEYTSVYTSSYQSENFHTATVRAAVLIAVFYLRLYEVILPVYCYRSYSWEESWMLAMRVSPVCSCYRLTADELLWRRAHSKAENILPNWNTV